MATRVPATSLPAWRGGARGVPFAFILSIYHLFLGKMGRRDRRTPSVPLPLLPLSYLMPLSSCMLYHVACSLHLAQTAFRADIFFTFYALVCSVCLLPCNFLSSLAHHCIFSFPCLVLHLLGTGLRHFDILKDFVGWDVCGQQHFLWT